MHTNETHSRRDGSAAWGAVMSHSTYAIRNTLTGQLWHSAHGWIWVGQVGGSRPTLYSPEEARGALPLPAEAAANAEWVVQS